MPANPAPRRGRPRKDGRPQNDWPVIIAEAARLAAEYEHPPALRRIFYRLIATGVLPNSSGDYSSLCSKTAEARRCEGGWDRFLPDGFFPDLDDATRSLDRPAYWADARDFAVGRPAGFRLDRDPLLDVTIILAVEKRGITPYLWDWFSRFGFAVFANAGYHSVPLEQRIARYIESEGRPARILFAGDHDASGDDIARNLERRVCGPNVTLHRIALTKAQVEQYGLPSWGGKEDDTRWPSFAERHGYDPDAEPIQVELDALPLDTLRDLYLAGIGEVLGLDEAPTLDSLWELPAFADARAQELDERQILEDLRSNWPAVVEFLRGRSA